jgi:hypothetical protein
MGILKKIAQILIGKDPDIFDDKGNVLHKHPKRLWDNWQNKYVKSDEHNWRKHTGTAAGSLSATAPKQENPK